MSGHTLSPSNPEPSAAVGSGLSRMVESVGTDEFLVADDGTRTWEVENVVDRDLHLADEAVESLRVLRLRTGDRNKGTLSTAALVLREFPDHHECELHVLSAPDWHEEGEVYNVTGVEVLDPLVPWVVAERSSDSSYHFPDPFAMARGEAVPACDVVPGDGGDYRVTRLDDVYPAKRACKACVRRHQPRVASPECGRVIARGLLHGRGADAITGVAIACPDRHCDFEGVVDLDV